MKNNKTEKITIKKSTLLGILHLLSLSAFSINEEGNMIGFDIDIGLDKCKKGEKFDHTYNYNKISERLEKLSKVNRLLMDAIPADDTSVSYCVDHVIKSAKFKKLLKWYGADLEDNFKKI